ncbi:hypothetical protein ABIB60_003086 [Hymenobacter sp. UYP22]
MPVSDPDANEQKTLVSVPPPTSPQTASTIRLQAGSLASYVADSLLLVANRDAHPTSSGHWRLLNAADVQLDSLAETLVNEEGSPKFLLYDIVYPVFHLSPSATPATALNAYYRAAYSEQFVHDTSTPRLAAWLRQRPAGKKRRYDAQEAAVDYQVRPYLHSLYITASQDTFLSSVGAYTSEVGSGNLSGLAIYSAQVTRSIQDVAVWFEQSLTRQPWPELDEVVRQRVGVPFLQVPETTGFACDYFFAPQGLLIGVNWADKNRDETEAFFLEIPYTTLTQRLQKTR